MADKLTVADPVTKIIRTIEDEEIEIPPALKDKRSGGQPAPAPQPPTPAEATPPAPTPGSGKTR